MRRSLLLLTGIIAITYAEFAVYPGHTYLAGESQPLVAMMERLNAHGFLSRDLTATSPNLTYTIYDEVTLFLCRATGHSMEWALSAQQIACRLAGVLGVLLLGLSAGMKALPALCAAAVISAGLDLPGLHLSLTDTEPTPFAFALALTVLAFGLLSSWKPLLAGLFGGIALLYQPSIALLFWFFVAAGFALRRELRPLLRPTLLAFLVFSLLLANAAQLQPGAGEAHPVLGRISEAWMQLQLKRTPEVWVSTWGVKAAFFYATLATPGYFALWRLRLNLTPAARWIFFASLTFGLISVPMVWLNFESFRWILLGELQPARAVALTVISALVLCGAAANRDWRLKRRWTGIAWLLPFALTLLLQAPAPPAKRDAQTDSIRSVAQWAERNTWGGSMFLFPDCGQNSIPGKFRGQAMRAIYVDWTSGALLKTLPAFGVEWARRWHEVHGESYSPSHLEGLLSLPVEYVVLKRANALRNVMPEFSTPDFLVYDAHHLQEAARPLRSANGS